MDPQHDIPRGASRAAPPAAAGVAPGWAVAGALAPLSAALAPLGLAAAHAQVAPLLLGALGHLDEGVLASLQFRPGCYTRHRLLTTSVLELVVIAWEVGSTSPVHDHNGQHCWLAVAAGQLEVRAFALADARQAGQTGEHIELVPGGDRLLAAGELDVRTPQQSIHRVRNPQRLGARAVSLHVYARPVTECVTYDLDARRAHVAHIPGA